MYVVRAHDLMEMRTVEPHQAMKATGRAFEYAGGTAIFVSHQWCGQSHPDPGMAQMRVLQRVLQEAASGALRVQPDPFSLLVWQMRAALGILEGGYVWGPALRKPD